MTPDYRDAFSELVKQRAKEALSPLPQDYISRNEWIDKQFVTIASTLTKLQNQIDSLAVDRDTHKEMYASFEKSLCSVRDMVEVIMKLLKAIVDEKMRE